MNNSITTLCITTTLLLTAWISEPCFAQEKTTEKPAFIRLEVTKNPFPDSVQIQFWEQPVDIPTNTPGALDLSLPLMSGNMYEATMESKVLDWTSPPMSGTSFITIRHSRYILFDRFIIEPGDSVRIGIDLEKGKVLFAGPSAAKFRIQQELGTLLEEDRFLQDVPMFTQSDEFWKSSPKDSTLYHQALLQKSSVHRTVFPVASNSDRTDFLKKKLIQDINKHNAWTSISSYEEKLDMAFLDLLRTEMLGKILFGPMDSFRRIFSFEPEFIELFEKQIVGNADSIPANAALSPHFMDYLYTKKVVVSAITKTPFRDLLVFEDSQINQTLEAKFILQNFRLFPDPNSQFEKSLERISDPYLAEVVAKVYRAQKLGAPVSGIALSDKEGKEATINDFKGKFLLLSFWLPGCSASESAYTNRLSALEEHFSEELKVVYIASSDDHKRWNELVSQGKYSNPEGINLRATQRKGSFLEYYNIRSFPTMMLIDPSGRMVNNGNFLYNKEGLVAYLESQIESYSDH